MRKHIKLPKVNRSIAARTLKKTARSARGFVGTHKSETFLGSLALAVAFDDLRIRLRRKKDQKEFADSSVKQQAVVRKHEAEINILKEESKQATEAAKKVRQLEQIVENIGKEGSAE